MHYWQNIKDWKMSITVWKLLLKGGRREREKATSSLLPCERAARSKIFSQLCLQTDNWKPWNSFTSYYCKLQAVKRKFSLLPLGSFVYNELRKMARGWGTGEEGRMLPEQKQHAVPFKFRPSWPTAWLPWLAARVLGQRLPPLAKTEEKGLLFNTGRLVSAREKNKKKGNYINWKSWERTVISQCG